MEMSKNQDRLLHVQARGKVYGVEGNKREIKIDLYVRAGKKM